jgi:hypothetical protein
MIESLYYPIGIAVSSTSGNEQEPAKPSATVACVGFIQKEHEQTASLNYSIEDRTSSAYLNLNLEFLRTPETVVNSLRPLPSLIGKLCTRPSMTTDPFTK